MLPGDDRPFSDALLQIAAPLGVGSSGLLHFARVPARRGAGLGRIGPFPAGGMGAA